MTKVSSGAPARAARRPNWVGALFALEAKPPYLRLALRGTLGLMAPLALGNFLGFPALNAVAFAAFLLAFGDLTEDSRWLTRLAAGSLFGALAVGAGVLLGATPVSAALGAFFLGAAFGLAGAYGDGAAAMALPVAWMFLELGLAAPGHSAAEAARACALVAAGGAWAIALAWAIRVIGRDGPLTEETARSFALLADYLEHALADHAGAPPHGPATPDGYGPSRETRVRAAIAEARNLAVEVRRREGGASRAGQRQVVLIELADQAFALGCALGETQPERAGTRRAMAASGGDDAAACQVLATAGAREVARLLARRRAAAPAVEEDLRRLAARRGRPDGAAAADPRGAGDADDGRSEIRGRLAETLAHAVHLAAGPPEPMPSAPEPEAGVRPRALDRWLAPLRTSLDRHSVIGRHALRFGVVLAVAVAIDKALHTPFSYWVPLTATVVLKPYAGSTLIRAGQRLASTVAGVTAGVLVLEIAWAPFARAAASAAAFFVAIAALPLNYAIAIFFLTIGVVPLEAMLGGEASWQIGLLRVAYTVAGGALALAGGFLLWPSFERQSLPASIAASLRSMARYADLVLALPAADAALPALVEAEHRRAGVDTTNLQATFQRVVAEPGEHRERLEASLLAVVALQRMLVSLNAMRTFAPAAAPSAPDWAGFRALLRRGLADLPAALEARRAPAALDAVGEARDLWARRAASGTRRDRLVTREMERMAWQVAGLRVAIARIAAVRGS
jgi:uncharacterized membrane protein YccC